MRVMAEVFFQALLKAALPVAALTFLLFYWSFKTGRLTGAGGKKGLEAELKALQAGEKKGEKTKNPVHNKWMEFGGGFYGVIALFTFIIIEALEVWDFAANFAGVSQTLQSLGIELVIGFFVESIMNFIAAIAWPAYWIAEIDTGHIWLWFLLAYGGYWAGMKLARSTTGVKNSNGEKA